MKLQVGEKAPEFELRSDTISGSSCRLFLREETSVTFCAARLQLTILHDVL
jgi:hypothetical protein